MRLATALHWSSSGRPPLVVAKTNNRSHLCHWGRAEAACRINRAHCRGETWGASIGTLRGWLRRRPWPARTSHHPRYIAPGIALENWNRPAKAGFGQRRTSPSRRTAPRFGCTAALQVLAIAGLWLRFAPCIASQVRAMRIRAGLFGVAFEADLCTARVSAPKDQAVSGLRRVRGH